MSDLTIRTATPDDAEALLAIYRPYVERTAITFEWEVPTVDDFRGRIVDHLAHYPYLVAEKGGRAVGYAYVGEFHERAAYQWSVETSIYLDINHRHEGLGTVLHAALEQACRQRGYQNMYACISYIDPEDEYLTQDSVRFHHRMGYRLVGRFIQCGKKFGRWYDMVWMEKLIGPHETESGDNNQTKSNAR